MRVSSSARPDSKKAASGSWEATLLAFLKKYSLPLALCLIAIGVLRIAATYPAMFATADEPGHFACGLEFLGKHVYRYESQHPPLARAAAALLPYWNGARPTGQPNQEREAQVVLAATGNPNRTITLARIGMLPFFVLACLVVYFWARHQLGNAVAVIATGLFTLLPPVLAHAGLATTDMAVAACIGAAFLALILWVEAATWGRTLWMGAAFALAALCKFTALLYLPAAVGLWLLWRLTVAWPGKRELLRFVKERAPGFAVAVVAGAFVVWAGYWFSFGTVAEWDMKLPAPEFFDGILSVLHHNDSGHMAYLMGSFSATGWWYYFPVVVAVKTPLAFLFLLAVGAWVCGRSYAKSAYIVPVVFSLGVLLPAMYGNINIGVRHILAIYLGLSILAALGVVQLMKWSGTRKWVGWLCGVLILWMAVSGALSHPVYLSYFNELAPADRERLLVDSDFDWGQDIGRLSRRLRDLGATEVSMGSEIHVPDEIMKWTGLPPIKPINPVVRAEGWTVVSPTVDKTTQYGLFHRFPNVRPWYESMKPTERVGALRLYYVPAGAAKPAKSHGLE